MIPSLNSAFLYRIRMFSGAKMNACAILIIGQDSGDIKKSSDCIIFFSVIYCKKSTERSGDGDEI